MAFDKTDNVQLNSLRIIVSNINSNELHLRTVWTRENNERVIVFWVNSSQQNASNRL